VRSLALPAIFVSCLFAADPSVQAPTEVEHQLRARVEAFDKLIVSEKYRDAEQFVHPDSRDAYYTSEKPRILDFEIQKIDWSEHFQTATIHMASNVMVRRAVIGAFEAKTTYFDHWKLDKGEWWLYYPQVMDRQTPFGVMKVNPTLGQESGLNLDAEIAKGKAQIEQARVKSFTADRTSVSLPASNSSETVVLSNLLPGTLFLGFHRISGSGFDISLAPNQLSANGNAQLRIYRSPQNRAEFKPGVVLLKATSTGQTVLITVN
jgi:hypothetical protein